MKAIHKKARSYTEFFVFVSPAMIFILLAAIIPFCMSLYYSLTKWNGVGKNIKFIGLDNFIELFTTDTSTLKSLLFTLLYGIIECDSDECDRHYACRYFNKRTEVESCTSCRFFHPEHY